ncbi:hypothetical protein NEF87_003398 [Candidatus Lokiarchaeum ossiferum]|uniref:Prefoldin subunit beta n=1 Tax=Candidatus Lokiarchaeum ossiferum TaxID=2951803 RepID=A0ABY6HUB8_9ARCH|nr:hypothetical protein NEF87_003398 [Candidatus Lokiarchaeum sp. B-35]
MAKKTSKKSITKNGKKSTKSKKSTPKKTSNAKIKSIVDTDELERKIESLNLENSQLKKQLQQLEAQKEQITLEFADFKKKYSSAIEKENLVNGISTIHDSRFRIGNKLVLDKLDVLYEDLKSVQKQLQQAKLSPSEKKSLTARISELNNKIGNLEKFIEN